MLQQLPALLGVLVGGTATFLLTNIGERARWRRDQRVRWDAARLDGYTRYADAVKRVVHVATRMAVARGLKHSSEPIDLVEGQLELSAATGHRTACWETVLLLGRPETVAAARAWHQSVWLLEFYARGLLSGQESWARALRDFERARSTYYRCARQDLGVTGEVVASTWPPTWYGHLSPDQQRVIESSLAHDDQERS